MKKIGLAIVSGFLVLAIIFLLMAEPVVGNPTPFDYVGPSTPDTNLPQITIQLPELNKTYNINNVPYSIIVEKPSSWFDYDQINGQLFSVVYYLDNGAKVTLANLSSIEEYYNKQPSNFQGSLSGLSDGNHSLEVYVYGVSYYLGPQQVQGVPSYYYLNNSYAICFMIDTTSPSISNLSIENRTYNTTEIPLNFEVNEPTSNITYCLDNASNVTISGNTTLTGLSVGAHNVTVYIRDVAGNIGSSQTIDFVVAHETEPEQKPFPTMVVVTASGASLVIVGIFLLVHFKKRKQQRE
jgi:hypothetical protein